MKTFICIMTIPAIIMTLLALAPVDVTIKWNAPTTNADGTPVNDLAGYKIYYSPWCTGIDYVTDVGNVTSWLMKGVDPFWCGCVTAYDDSGNESECSNHVFFMKGQVSLS